MKKLTALLLAASVILSLASCGGTESASTTTSGSTTTTTAATEGTTTPSTTTTEETTTTPETTTSDEGTTTTPETTTASAETTTTPPETSASTTTTKVTTTSPTTTTTKPVTTTKVTTTKPVTTTAPKTEATTTTTAAPTYDHCEGFNKIWGKSSAAYYDIMNGYGEYQYGLSSPYAKVYGWYCSGKSVYVYGMKLKSIYFYAYPDDYTDYDSSSTAPHYCRSLYMEVNETSDGETLTLESAEEMISALYGPSEKNVDDSGKVSYHWYGTADGDIELSESGSYNTKLEIYIQESGWVCTWTP